MASIRGTESTAAGSRKIINGGGVCWELRRPRGQPPLPVRLLLASRLLRRGTPLGDRRRRGLGCCTRPVHRTNGHPGRTLKGGASHEPWATLCRHPPVPEVAQHSVNPCLVGGVRTVVSGRKAAVQRAGGPDLLRFTGSVNHRCGEADRGDSKQTVSYDRVSASRNRWTGSLWGVECHEHMGAGSHSADAATCCRNALRMSSERLTPSSEARSRSRYARVDDHC